MMEGSSSGFGGYFQQMSALHQRPPPLQIPPLKQESCNGEESEDAANAPTPPAVDAARLPPSALVLISQTPQAHGPNGQEVFICTIPGPLKHGQQVHLITSQGQIYTTALAQLSLDVNGSMRAGSPCSSTKEERQATPASVHVSPGPSSPQETPRRSGSLSTQVAPEPSRLPAAVTSSYSDEPSCASLFESTLFGRRLSEPALQLGPPGTSLLFASSASHHAIHAASSGLPRGRLSSVLVSSTSDRGSSDEPEVSIDGINLEEIKEFAKLFKMKRLSLGLTQTQVGQALSLTEGPAYSQSAICRFEKLDITPKSAQKIKPVLERWMDEMDEKLQSGELRLPTEPLCSTQLQLPTTTTATTPTTQTEPMPISAMLSTQLGPLRLPRTVSSPEAGEMDLSMSPPLSSPVVNPSALAVSTAANLALMLQLPPTSPGYPATVGSCGDASRKRKRRTSFTPQALDLLNQFFHRNTHPSGGEMTSLAESLGYEREVVRVWFCNKRQALKNTIKKLKTDHPEPLLM